MTVCGYHYTNVGFHGLTSISIVELQNETGYQSAELWIIDLSLFSSVIAFADKFEKDGGRLDILVENAACGLFTYDTTPDGWETS